MFYIRLFQWERFISRPSSSCSTGSSSSSDSGRPVGLVSALGAMAFNPVAGAFTALASFAGMLLGILFARIVAEFVLMVFRINEHLSAIRNRGGM